VVDDVAQRPVSLHGSDVGHHGVWKTKVEERSSSWARDRIDREWFLPLGLGIVYRLLHELPSKRLPAPDREPMVVTILA